MVFLVGFLGWLFIYSGNLVWGFWVFIILVVGVGGCVWFWVIE